MSFHNNLTSLVAKFDELGNKLAKGPAELGNDFKTISKEYANLSPIVELINKLFKLEKEYEGLANVLDSETDLELKEMFKEEYYSLKEQIDKVTEELQIALLPKDKDDDKNIILEIRAGTGGDEAGLFAGDLFRMYQKYAELHRWKVELISVSETGVGGFKEVIAEITGLGVFAKLKFESGVHRVQRIPDTETNGRVHTSAATVAVLPEAVDVDVKIDEKDLKIDIYRASGAGGQHVNTTDSAVRLTHLPTGIVVVQQDERSQHKNRAKAMKILMSRIYEQQKKEQDAERSLNRKTQVGSGDRSERIRTYNFPQGRVSDHRINLTLYKLDKVMEGELDEIIDALIAHDQALKLAESPY